MSPPDLTCPVCGGPLVVETEPSEHYDGDHVVGIACADVDGCGAEWGPDGTSSGETS